MKVEHGGETYLLERGNDGHNSLQLFDDEQYIVLVLLMGNLVFITFRD